MSLLLLFRGAESTHQGAVTMTATSTLTVAATKTFPASAVMTELSQLDVAGSTVPVLQGTVAMSGASSLTVLGVVTRFTAAAMSEASSLVVTPTLSQRAVVGMTSTHNLTVAAVVTKLADIAMTETSDLNVTGVRQQSATVDMVEASLLTAVSVLDQSAVVTMTETSILSFAATLVRVSSVALSSVSTLTVVALQPYSDDFNRADGGLGTNWVSLSGANAPQIVSQQIVGGTNAVTGIRYVTPTNTDDQYAQVTYRGGVLDGPAVAMPAFLTSDTAAATGTWYAFRQASGGGATTAIVQKDVGAGTFTVLASAAGSMTSGDVMRLQYVGGVLTAYVNGVQRITYTPVSPISDQRFVGFINNAIANSGVAILDDWWGGDVSFVQQTGTAALVSTSTLSTAAVRVQPVSVAMTESSAL